MNNKINTKLYRRIIAYGCSYTAGDEIADHLILNISFAECNKLKQKFKNQAEFQKHYNINNYSGNEIMDKHTWSGKLAQLCNLPYVSRAIPGSSIGHSYFKIYRDYLNNLINQDDLVLVGITSPERVMYWDKDSSEPDSCPLTQYLNYLKPEAQKSVMDLVDDNILVLQYFSFLQNISNLKNLMNIRLQPMLSNNIPGHKEFRYKMRSDIDNAIKHMYDNMDNILVRDQSLTNRFALMVGKCGFSHQPLEAHTYLANQIFKFCVVK